MALLKEKFKPKKNRKKKKKKRLKKDWPEIKFEKVKKILVRGSDGQRVKKYNRPDLPPHIIQEDIGT